MFAKKCAAKITLELFMYSLLIKGAYIVYKLDRDDFSVLSVQTSTIKHAMAST